MQFKRLPMLLLLLLVVAMLLRSASQMRRHTGGGNQIGLIQIAGTNVVGGGATAGGWRLNDGRRKTREIGTGRPLDFLAAAQTVGVQVDTNAKILYWLYGVGCLCQLQLGRLVSAAGRQGDVVLFLLLTGLSLHVCVLLLGCGKHSLVNNLWALMLLLLLFALLLQHLLLLLTLP